MLIIASKWVAYYNASAWTSFSDLMLADASCESIIARTSEGDPEHWESEQVQGPVEHKAWEGIDYCLRVGFPL